MSDRELLEAAARAAGLAIDRWYVDGGCAAWQGVPRESDWLPLWNPLTDDGDAMRLATRCCVLVKWFVGYVVAASIPGSGPAVSFEIRFADCGDDPLAATRRAIVRAAAMIGGYRE